MKLICGNIFFNDEEFLERWLWHHYPLFDEIIMIDGAYEHFSHQSLRGQSVDSSIPIIQHFKIMHDHENKIRLILPQRPWKTEMEKRTVYLQYGLLGDWVFVTDSDSFVWGDISRLRKLLRTTEEYAFSPKLIDYPRKHLQDNPYPVTASTLGIIQCMYGAQYYKNHWTVLHPINEEKVRLSGPWWRTSKDFVQKIHLSWVGWVHFPRTDPKRNKLKEDYYKIHGEVEDLEPWKWPEEEWNKIVFEGDEYHPEMQTLREGYLEAKKEVKELGWD